MSVVVYSIRNAGACKACKGYGAYSPRARGASVGSTVMGSKG